MDSFVGDAKDLPSRDADIEMGARVPGSNSDLGMDAFNEQIQDVEKQVDELSGLLTKLKDANEESKSITQASSMKAIKKRMEKDVDEVGKIARNVKAKLEAISKDNLANRQKPGCGKGTGVDQSRTNMTNALTKKFRDLIIEFQSLRQRIQDEYREIVEQRVITVTGTRPDDETIDRLIETGNSEQIFQKAIQEMGRGQVLNTVEEIQERHDAVKELEKKLLDLHQIDLDMVVLVEAQGDILDNNESQIDLDMVVLVEAQGDILDNNESQVYLDMAVLVKAEGDISDNIESQETNEEEHVNTRAGALHTARDRKKQIIIMPIICMMMAICLPLTIAGIIVLAILHAFPG